MDVVLKSESMGSNENVSQKNVLQDYLNFLLKVSENSSTDDFMFDENLEQFTPSEKLYHSVLTEIENADQHLKSPRWATEYFSCLPVTVDDLTLFVPLRKVRMVVPMNQEIVSLNELPKWIVGSMKTFRKQINVVDLKQIVNQNIQTLVESKVGRNLSVETLDVETLDVEKESNDKSSKVVVISNGNWGLSCDSVGRVQQLNQNEIRWRGRGSSYRWISGLSIKHQLAIIDVKRIEFAMAFERSLV